MGKAVITSESGDGLYTVTVKHDTTDAQKRLSRIDLSIATVTADLAVLEPKIETAETVVELAADTLSAKRAAVVAAKTAEAERLVERDTDQAYIDAVAALSEASSELNAALAEDPVDQLRVDAATADVQTAQQDLATVPSKIFYDTAVDTTTAAEAEVITAESVFAQKVAALASLNSEKLMLNTRLTPLSKEKKRIESALDMDFSAPAWCADLTKGLTGEVGTIEAAAEYKNGVNILPGGVAHSAAFDGNRNALFTLSVADAMRNFAIMPGIQKYCPTYRYATISNIDVEADTCRVDYEPTVSGIQNLDVNLYTFATDVPVDYMTCNAAAFSDGDSVIVKFSGNSWFVPVVIGFKSNPKPCENFNFKIKTINGVAFPSGSNLYQLRLIQHVPQVVDGGTTKGTYTEDFTVIGGGAVDNVGAISIEVEDGVEINPVLPLYAQLKNPSKFTYWSTDWKGNCPNYGVVFSAAEGSEQWDTYPTSGLDDYDFLLDYVGWFHSGIDVRLEEQSIYQNAASEVVTGIELNITGVKALRQDHCQYFVTDMECDRGGETDPPTSISDAADDVFPVSFIDHDYSLVSKVPYDFKYSLWHSHYYYLTNAWQCYQTTTTATCPGGATGLAYRYYYPLDWYAGSGPVTSFGDPGIKSDRFGQVLTYSESKQAIDVENQFSCMWIWMQTLSGEVPVNWKEQTTRIVPNACESGEGVIVGVWNPATVNCGQKMAEVGEQMKYEIIDLDADSI